MLKSSMRWSASLSSPKLNAGIKQADAGEVVSHDEVKQRLSRWLE
ncbi:MAG TPA: hypothetical protein PLK77_01360 [Pyrinomonadaceae bacterium]|nr:hypothetical protein [Pyrinomonadaceae bacterium]